MPVVIITRNNSKTLPVFLTYQTLHLGIKWSHLIILTTNISLIINMY